MAIGNSFSEDATHYLLQTASSVDMELKVVNLCRDGFHMSFDYGRYLVSCVWPRALCGVDAERISYFQGSLNLTAKPEQAF